MKKMLFTVRIILLLVMPIIFAVNTYCAAEETKLVSVSPKDGTTLSESELKDKGVTVKFYEPVQSISVSGKLDGQAIECTAELERGGRRANISPAFDVVSGQAVLELAISWTQEGEVETATVAYTLEVPDTVPPEISNGTVRDGDKDVDPDPLNTDGIVIRFSEPVNAGKVVLRTESGDDLGWIPVWADDRVTLEPLAGSELGGETTYIIDITGVKDEAGNSLGDTEITFTTEPKPENGSDETLDFPMEEDAKDGSADDKSGNDNNGIIQGYPPKTIEGKIGNAWEFQKDSSIIVKASATLNTFLFLNDYAIAFWVKPVFAIDSAVCLVWEARSEMGKANATLWLSKSGVVHWKLYGFSVETSENSFKEGEWNHVCVSGDENTTRIYANFELKREEPTPGEWVLESPDAEYMITALQGSSLDEFKVLPYSIYAEDLLAVAYPSTATQRGGRLGTTWGNIKNQKFLKE